MSLQTLRMIELIVISAGGIVSIFLGYRLFMATPTNQILTSGGTFKSALFNLTFSKAGPGVFFALFGAFILSLAISTKIDVESTTGIAEDQQSLLISLTKTVDQLPESTEKTSLSSLLGKHCFIRTFTKQHSGAPAKNNWNANVTHRDVGLHARAEFLVGEAGRAADVPCVRE